MSLQLSFAFFFGVIFLDIFAIAETPTEAAQRLKESNLQFPQYPSADVLADKLSLMTQSMMDASTGGACSKLARTGTCGDNKPIALMLYNPYIREDNGAKIDAGVKVYSTGAPEKECSLYKMEMEKKGFCVEGQAVYTADSILTVPKGRYSHITLANHGLPGKLIAPFSPCEFAALVECEKKSRTTKKNYSYSTCISQVTTDPSTQDLKNACPCSKEQKTYQNQIAKIATGVSSTALANATDEWKKCAETDHADEYSKNIRAKDLAQLSKGKGQILTFSCATAADDKAGKALSKQFCTNAPDGLVFNLSKTVNKATNICSPKLVAYCGILCTNDLCASGVIKRGSDEEKAYSDYFNNKKDGSDKNWLVEKFPSSFICFQCKKQGDEMIALKMPDCSGLINPFFADIPYEQMPEAIKEETNEVIRHNQLSNGPGALIPQP